MMQLLLLAFAGEFNISDTQIGEQVDRESLKQLPGGCISSSAPAATSVSAAAACRQSLASSSSQQDMHTSASGIVGGIYEANSYINSQQLQPWKDLPQQKAKAS